MIVNMDPSGVGAVIKVKKRISSRRVPAGIVRTPVALESRYRRNGTPVVVQAAVSPRTVIAAHKRAAAAAFGPRVAFSNLVKRRASNRALVMAAGRFQRQSVVNGGLSGLGAAKKPILKRLKKSITLKKALKVAAVAGAAVVLPGAAAGAAKLVAGGGRVAASAVVKQAARSRAIMKKAAAVAVKSVRAVNAKAKVQKRLKDAVAFARKQNVKKIHSAMTSPTVKAAAVLAAGGGAAAVITSKVLARANQQIPAGAGEGDKQASSPVNIMSISPVSATAEQRNVDALAPADAERRDQQQAALEQAAKSAGVETKPVPSSSGMNPMMIAAAAAAALVVLPMLTKKGRS